MKVYDPATGQWQAMGTQQIEVLASLGDVTEACPYLPEEKACLHFISGEVAGPSYRELLDQGYRRNGVYLYRPVCAQCSACEVLRVPIATFQQSRGQRRVWRRGTQHFTCAVEPAQASPGKSALYSKYLAWQHNTQREEIGESQYEEFLVRSCAGVETFEVQLWKEGALAGVGVVDCMEDALSSVYFYFDPAWARLSPGTFSALCEIELAREWGLKYYYLGYYIAACRQMNYKARFRPCEIKQPGAKEWRRVEREQ
ncbi:MAG: arginyltransferase [Candidatus Hydrogenedentes bacterium]|nr:arginyltransferase [Candidatus Hydrogenedentota bacterium]